LWTDADVILHQANNRSVLDERGKYFDLCRKDTKSTLERTRNKGYWKREFKETASAFPHKILQKIEGSSPK